MTDLPATWRYAPLAEIAAVQGGIQKQPKRAPRSNRYPFLRVANVTAAGLDLRTVHEIELFGEDELDRLRLHPGDLLVVEGNGSPAQIGRAAVWDGSIKDCVHQNHLIRVRPGPALLPEYLGLIWNSPTIRQNLTEVASSTSGLHTLSVAKLKKIALPLPTLEEQRRIVVVLEGHLSRLDAAAATLAVAAQRLHRLQERLVLDAITGSSHDSERSECQLAGVGSNDGNLPDLPMGWTWSRLGDVADVVGGVTKDAKKQADPGFIEVPYLRVANVQRGRLDLSDVARIRVSPSKAEALSLRPGDVLLNEGGDRDKLARGWVWEGQIEHCIHQNHVFRARVRNPRLDPYFLSWTTNTIGGRWAERNGKQSVNLASISLSMIRRMPVIVPASGHASVAIARLRDELDSMARLREEIARAETQNKALRRAVLAAAFTGALSCRTGEVPVSDESVVA